MSIQLSFEERAACKISGGIQALSFKNELSSDQISLLSEKIKKCVKEYRGYKNNRIEERPIRLTQKPDRDQENAFRAWTLARAEFVGCLSQYGDLEISPKVVPSRWRVPFLNPVLHGSQK